MNIRLKSSISSELPAHECEAEYFEYSKAANPISAILIPRIPYHSFPASLYNSGESRLVPLDLSESLGCEGPATGPGLCANFIRLNAGDSLRLEPNATSQVLYVIAGSGGLVQGEHRFEWAKGCFMALPGLDAVVLTATEDTRMYYVHDEPLLRFLGVTRTVDRFAPTLYPAEVANAKLREAAEDPRAQDRSRISILLANRAPHLLGAFMAAASIIPVGDAVIVLRSGGTRAAAFGIHGATAAVMLAAGVALLMT